MMKKWMIALLLSLLCFPVAALAQDSGKLSKDQIRDTVQANTASVKTCYEKALVKAPDLAGKITIQFTVEADGSVSTASLKNSELNTTVDGCLLDAVQTWTFPKPSNGGKVVITYPFVFQSQPAPKAATNSFSKAGIKTAMKTHQAAIQACNTQGALGKMTLSFTLQGDGTINHVAFASSAIQDDALEACVKQIVAGWTLGAPKDGKDTKISYPLIFKSTTPP